MKRPLLVIFLVALCLTIVLLSGGCRDQTSESKTNTELKAIGSVIERENSLSQSQLDLLVSTAEDPRPTKRAKSITLLSYTITTEEKKIAQKVAKMHLDDSDPLVRHASLNALRRLKDPSVVDTARKMVNDPSSEVREVATRIIRSSGQ
jgi:HEAT repeat protein